jgi:hypothetical protein
MDIARGYIALIDPDWYRYLSNQPHLDEVKFRQPHGDHEFRALPRESRSSSDSGLHRGPSPVSASSSVMSP